jgi:hypothetical protein
MAEKIISPGVFTNEIDQTFLPSAVADIGAALIGPTVKGPAGIPTVVTSFSDFQAKFGDVFKSGSNSFQFLTSHAAEQYLKNSDTLTVVRIMDGTIGGATSNVPTGSETLTTGKSGTSFKLTTLADGRIMNNSGSIPSTNIHTGSNDILLSGSIHNVRFDIPTVNKAKGTFTLRIRRGDDNVKRPLVLETFSGINLDPNSPNFISKVVGDQFTTTGTDENGKTFLKLNGDFPNKSRFVRVSEVQTTIDYLDENGNVRLSDASASLPNSGSGSQHGAFGDGLGGVSDFDAFGTPSTALAHNFYENVAAQTQGFTPNAALSDANGGSAYKEALDLLSNQDEYDINLILTPGIISSVHGGVASKVIDVCEDRGDCFAILDPVIYGKNVVDATSEAETRNSNFAAMYWPWVKVPDTLVSGTQRWVPPSVVLGGIYAFNDKVAHPWFAPAGLNRGGIDTAIQAERKLTQADRDTLYDSNVNPIATFPGQGVTVFGQKTLQKKSSALDRINVRRLLIRVKKFIASSSRFLVFEQNTVQTRNRFLGIVNPFLEQVQSQSGLNAFRVVMDETNNTADTIDRNLLVGQLFLQPTRTAEFIVLDFTIQPTGASFPE